MNSHEVFIHIHQGCFAGTGAIVRLPQCQWSKPDGYGKISQCITTTKHSKAKTVCIFLGIYCTWINCDLPIWPLRTKSCEISIIIISGQMVNFGIVNSYHIHLQVGYCRVPSNGVGRKFCVQVLVCVCTMTEASIKINTTGRYSKGQYIFWENQWRLIIFTAT